MHGNIYAHDASCWSLYVEEDPLDKLPDLRQWHGHGILVAFGLVD